MKKFNENPFKKTTPVRPFSNGTELMWAELGVINKLEDTMTDSEVPAFFERATGRKYVSRETSVNDIRRMCALFWNENTQRKAEKTGEGIDRMSDCEECRGSGIGLADPNGAEGITGSR